jgi:hypothetical protein
MVGDPELINRRTPILRVALDPWLVRLAQPLAVEDFRITRIKILDYSAERVSLRCQQGLHSQVGQTCRGENPISLAEPLEFIEEAGCYMVPAMSCININQQHKATTKKLVVHYAVSEGSCRIEREKAFPSTDGTLDGGSTGWVSAALGVHPRDVLEIRANRRTNCHKTQRDFVWRLRFVQFMPSEVKRRRL